MADDEQFSLCWNNFNSNLSAGFHESLCRGDLVDVTLAAEGQFVKAHRLVLSVCSPYFRKMFTQMPANQHAFVFLKDVSHTALKDLIQFMYCGEVNVKQEALPAFISTAEALQIKGLTDSDPPPEPSTPTPPIQQIASPRVRQRTSTARSYKIETVEDSGDDNKQPTQIVIQTNAAPPPHATIVHHHPQPQQQHHVQQSQQPPQQITSATVATTSLVTTNKRAAQRSVGSSAPHVKRTKSTIDPLDPNESATTTTTTIQPQQITVQTAVVTTEPKIQQPRLQQQQQTETEYIDLPIELPTKSEPDYTEEAGEVVSGEQDASYVEDDSYGDMRYDESYFTENEDATPTAVSSANTSGTVAATTSKAVAKQQTFSESSYVDSADQANSDAQEFINVPRKRGRPKVKDETIPQIKLLDKLHNAAANFVGQPAVYASTTKGGMKLVYDGHHFKYSFRKGQYSIFQCCYKENKRECKVRVVSDQKHVYPLDGEHVHFILATDKSVTSGQFIPSGEADVDADDDVIIGNQMEQFYENDPNFGAYSKENELEDEDAEDDNPNDFREKIKKRLQKALQGKKK